LGCVGLRCTALRCVRLCVSLRRCVVLCCVLTLLVYDMCILCNIPPPFAAAARTPMHMSTLSHVVAYLNIENKGTCCGAGFFSSISPSFCESVSAMERMFFATLFSLKQRSLRRFRILFGLWPYTVHLAGGPRIQYLQGRWKKEGTGTLNVRVMHVQPPST
jgi:hypothetical protein